MAEKRIDELREILTKAAARDAELLHALEELAGDLLKELGCDGAPVWAKLEATDHKRQVSPFFLMEDLWLRGDLQVVVTPEQTCVVSLVIRDVADHQHEAGLEQQRSQTATIDPPDPKHRADARKKVFDLFFSDLEAQLRGRLAFPRE